MPVWGWKGWNPTLFYSINFFLNPILFFAAPKRPKVIYALAHILHHYGNSFLINLSQAWLSARTENCHNVKTQAHSTSYVHYQAFSLVRQHQEQKPIWKLKMREQIRITALQWLSKPTGGQLSVLSQWSEQFSKSTEPTTRTLSTKRHSLEVFSLEKCLQMTDMSEGERMGILVTSF